MDKERENLLVRFALETYSMRELIEAGDLWDRVNFDFEALEQDEKEFYEELEGTKEKVKAEVQKDILAEEK